MDILRKLFRSLVLVSTTDELNQRTLELANLTSNVHDRIGWGDARHLRRVLQVIIIMLYFTFTFGRIIEIYMCLIGWRSLPCCQIIITL